MDELFLESLCGQQAKVSLNDFSMMSLLGKGSYAKVVQVRCKLDKKIYAMKVIKKKHEMTKQQLDRLRTERKVLLQADCPFVVRLHFAFQDASRVYLVLEYCAGGELFSLLRHRHVLTESAARFYTA